jgi:hypothetical protein
MSTGRSVLLLGTFLALLSLSLSLSSGCLSASIGKATYDGSTLLVPVTNTGGSADAALQVNVFRFQDFRQVEVSRTIVPVTLRQGTGTYAIPLQLDDGTFRLYLYVITGSDRRAGVIQDITVATHGTPPRISSR